MPKVTFLNVAPSSELRPGEVYRPELHGFDDTATPVWQMVPLNGKRFVQVKVIGAKKWLVESDTPRVASVSSADPTGQDARLQDAWWIDGAQEGKAFVTVREPGGPVLERLEVCVMRLRTFSVQFFLVSDNHPRTTATKEDDVKSWVDLANKKVFEPQLNLTFKISAVKPHPINEDLGNPIDLGLARDTPYVPPDTPGHKRWHTITDKGDTRPEIFNVFCVWDFQMSGLQEKLSGFVQSKVPIKADAMEKSGANFNMCIMKDVPPDDMGNIPYLIFAHEAGHYLEGFPRHYPDDRESGLLMRGDGEIGQRLLKEDAVKMTRRW